MASFKLLKVNWQDHSFLSFMGQIFTSNDVQVMVDFNCQELSRTDCDGIIHAVGWVGDRLVGVAFNDFRINGGSFSAASALRSNAFFKLMDDSQTPVVLVLNTLGVRFMEGRTVFEETFSMLPEITRFAEKNPLITISVGRTLGLGAILFGLGHYRMAVRGDSLINLTGPEVINLFFGKGFDYASLASAESQLAKTNLVHELVESRDEALRRTRTILTTLSSVKMSHEIKNLPSSFEGEHIDADLISSSEHRLRDLRAHFNGGTMEIFSYLSSIVRTYIGIHDGKLMGVFMNPPGHAGNMINTRALEKYEAALQLFKVLQLPIVSFLDTSGAEPRTTGAETNLLGKFIQVAGLIINYPHAKMGFVVGRCFGGATILSFPKNFGGRFSFAVEGSRMGVMHDDIITKLLTGSARLLEKWKEVVATQTADMSDLKAKGSIDDLIKMDMVGSKLSMFLTAPAEIHKESVDLSEQVLAFKKQGAV